MNGMAWKDLLRDTNLLRRVWYDVIVQSRYAGLIRTRPMESGILQVTMGDYSFYYPSGADLSILGRTYYEIFDPHCGHYYDIEQTRPGPRDVVLDIGACEGLYSLKHVDSVQTVYLFEPSRAMCRCLELTFSNKPADRFRIWNVMLSSAARDAVPFYEDLADPTLSRIAQPGDGNTYPLEVQSVDSLAASGAIRTPTLLKMDVQGAELDILKGARHTIAEHKPRMAITTYHYPMDAREILDFVLSIRPDYRYVLKGVTTVDPVPRPTMAHFF